MLTVAYGEATLDRSNVYRWYKMFSEGREDVNDEERAGHPSTSTTDENIDEVKKIVLANRRITVREVAEDLNISIGSCHSIFTNDLGMRRVAAKFVPKLLNFDQKQHRIEHAKASNYRSINVILTIADKLLNTVDSNVKAVAPAIIKVQKTNPLTYLVKDYRGKPVVGGFYEYELHRIANLVSLAVVSLFTNIPTDLASDSVVVRWDAISRKTKIAFDEFLDGSKFKIVNSVRMSKYKMVFEKGYMPNWIIEVFTIIKVQHINDEERNDTQAMQSSRYTRPVLDLFVLVRIHGVSVRQAHYQPHQAH
ncbi:SETMR methyltransferase, partial [Acromyrmex charruanus]